MIALDQSMAIEGAALGGNAITESGAYVGKIVEAKPFNADNSSAAGVEITFEREDGAQAKFIKVYTVKKDGGEAFGLKQVHALMACMRLPQLNSWPDLCRPVGLILQREDYTKQDGKPGYSMKILAPFQPQTRQTADELINQQQAQTVDRIVAKLVDKPRAMQQNESVPYQQEAQPGFDGDAPF